MRRRFVISSALLALTAMSGEGQAAGRDTVRIVIEGGAIRTPIVLADHAIAGRFKVGTGPGTYEVRRDGVRMTNLAPSFIIEWDRGVTDPPKGTLIYQVALVTGRRDS